MFEIRTDQRTLALQLRDGIRLMLRQKDYHAGDRLPSEENLAAMFGVSRTTVREALKYLEEERVITCRHGAGRFLAYDPSGILREDVTRLQSVTEMALGLGIPISTKVLDLRLEPADEALRRHLNLAEGEQVYRLERARLAEGETLIYSIDIFPQALVKGEVREQDLTTSLVEIMERQWNARLVYSKTTISATLLEPDLCRRLNVSPTSAWIMMEQVNFNEADRPILYSKDYHRSDKFRFNVLRRRR